MFLLHWACSSVLRSTRGKYLGGVCGPCVQNMGLEDGQIPTRHARRPLRAEGGHRGCGEVTGPSLPTYETPLPLSSAQLTPRPDRPWRSRLGQCPARASLSPLALPTLRGSGDLPGPPVHVRLLSGRLSLRGSRRLGLTPPAQPSVLGSGPGGQPPWPRLAARHPDLARFLLPSARLSRTPSLSSLML